MTIRALIEAVEAGNVVGWNRLANIAEDVMPPKEAALTATAYHGSLDAAKALHDALLPGWIASIDTDGFARVYWPGPVITVMQTVRLDVNPARAWLLAILRAMEAKEAGE